MHLPESCHGNDCIPEGNRYAGECRVWNVLFSVEHDGRENDDRHGEREYEKTELAGTTLECVAEYSQASRVTRKLEYPFVHSEDHMPLKERLVNFTLPNITLLDYSSREFTFETF